MELMARKQQTPRLSWSYAVRQETGGLMRKGGLYCLLVFALFLIWAIWVPISSSVVAVGRVMAASQNKLLQHPTGGVVRAIVARDGAYLKAGDVVIEVDPEARRAELVQLKSRHDLLQAQKERFEAEQATIQYTLLQTRKHDESDHKGLPRPKPKRTVADQPAHQTKAGVKVGQPDLVLQGEFQARMDNFQSEMSSLENQADALRSEFAGLQPQIRNQQDLANLQKEQLEQVRPLLKEKYFSKVRFTQMEVAYLDAESRLTHLQAQSRATRARIAEVNDRIAQLASSRREEHSRELARLDSELSALSEQIRAAEKAVSYTQIRSPADGILVKLTANTVGGVIRPGEVIGEIVPASGGVMVEARIPPQDIANVHMGQSAKIVVSAFNRRLVDPFDAEVKYVAADSTLDELTGERYFAARLFFRNPDGKDKLVLPGMAAESYIQLGSRSFLGYLMKPVGDSFRRAFQER